MDPTQPAFLNPLFPALGGEQQGEQQESPVSAVGEEQQAQQPSAAEQVTGPAVGGHIQAHAPVGPSLVPEESAQFRTIPEWDTLLTWVDKNRRVPAWETLSAHTTSACQPGKATGPSGG